MNFLITCGGGIQGIALISELRKVKGSRLYLSDWKEKNINRFEVDVFYVAPPISDSKEYLSFILDLCSCENIDYVIPATALDTMLLSSIRDSLSVSGTICFLPKTDFLLMYLDKSKWNAHLLKRNIQQPKVYNTKEKVQFPVIVKERSAWGGKGMSIYETPESFSSFNWDDRWMVMEFLSNAAEYSLDFLVSPSGKLHGPICRKRESVSGGFALVSTWESMPQSIIKQWSVLKEELEHCDKMGYYNVQFLVKNEEAYLIDINPRIGTSCTISSSMYSLGLMEMALSEKNGPLLKTEEGLIIRRIQDIALPKKNLKDVKLLIFDLDDTLISNSQFILKRCGELYSQLFNDLYSHSEFINYCRMLILSGRAFELIDRILSRFPIQYEKDFVLESYRAILPLDTTVFPGTQETLSYLKRKGYKLAIYSSSSIRLIHHKLHTSSLTEYFSECLSSEVTGIGDKSSFSVVKERVAEMGIQMNQVIMIGDNYFEDILGGINAGCQAAFYAPCKGGMVPEVLMSDVDYLDSVVFLPSLTYLKNFL